MTASKFTLLLFLVLLSCALAAQTPIFIASAGSSPEQTLTEITETTPAELFTAPTYPGGRAALLQQLGTKVKYPQLARDYSVEGTVVVRLSLDDTGRITKQEVVRSLGFGCDEAALKAITKLDRFQPALRGGHNTSSVVYVPLRFRLR